MLYRSNFKIPFGKSNPPSQFDEEFVVATIDKIYKALNLSDKNKLLCNTIGLTTENSNYTKLRNYVIITALKFINSSIPSFNQKHHRTELCNSKCFPSDFSIIDTTKITISNPAFIYFLILNCSLIMNSQDRKIIKSVNMSNNQIVINPSTSGIQVTIDFPISSEHKKLVSKYREALQNKVEKINANSHYLNQFTKDLHESDGTFKQIVKKTFK